MVIDIDSFLDRYDEVELKEEEKKDYSINFENEVKEKISEFEREGLSADFNLLKQIYDEIKAFDESIPSKFMGIGDSGNRALKELGNKYSRDFLNKAKNNANILDIQIKEKLQKLDSMLQSFDFGTIIKEFESILVLYKQYPQYFIKEKLEISIEIRKREININQMILEYKEKKLLQIRQVLKINIDKLNNSLVPGNREEIEDNIDKLFSLVYSIPKLFLADLISEKQHIAKMMHKAEQFLKEEYQRDFSQRVVNIENLSEKFQTLNLHGNANGALLIYDEILFEFKKMPDVFLEKKVDYYEKINKLFITINSLLIKKNINDFLESYNSSKFIQEARDYIQRVKITKKANIANLTLLRENLFKVPNKFAYEKDSLLREIEFMIKTASSIASSNENFEDNYSSDFNNDNQNFSMPLDLKEEIKETAQKSDSNKSTLEQIKIHLERLKKTNNSKEFYLLENKIKNYSNSLNASSKTKSDIISLIENIKKAKKFN